MSTIPSESDLLGENTVSIPILDDGRCPAVCGKCMRADIGKPSILMVCMAGIFMGIWPMGISQYTVKCICMGRSHQLTRVERAMKICHLLDDIKSALLLVIVILMSSIVVGSDTHQLYYIMCTGCGLPLVYAFAV
jgi:hypothetical protein